MKRHHPAGYAPHIPSYVLLVLAALTLLGLAGLAVTNTYALRVRWGSGEVDMRPAPATLPASAAEAKAGSTAGQGR